MLLAQRCHVGGGDAAVDNCAIRKILQQTCTLILTETEQRKKGKEQEQGLRKEKYKLTEVVSMASRRRFLPSRTTRLLIYSSGCPSPPISVPLSMSLTLDGRPRRRGAGDDCGEVVLVRCDMLCIIAGNISFKAATTESLIAPAKSGSVDAVAAPREDGVDAPREAEVGVSCEAACCCVRRAGVVVEGEVAACGERAAAAASCSSSSACLSAAFACFFSRPVVKARAKDILAPNMRREGRKSLGGKTRARRARVRGRGARVRDRPAKMSGDPRRQGFVCKKTNMAAGGAACSFARLLYTIVNGKRNQNNF